MFETEMFDMKMFDEFKFYGNLLMLRFYKEIKCLKWKWKYLPSAPSLANCSSKLLPKGSLTCLESQCDGNSRIFSERNFVITF